MKETPLSPDKRMNKGKIIDTTHENLAQKFNDFINKKILALFCSRVTL